MSLPVSPVDIDDVIRFLDFLIHADSLVSLQWWNVPVVQIINWQL